MSTFKELNIKNTYVSEDRYDKSEFKGSRR